MEIIAAINWENIFVTRPVEPGSQSGERSEIEPDKILAFRFISFFIQIF